MTKEICFDMDGTLAGLYDVANWLEELENHNPTPYEIAKPLLNMSALARLIHKAQRFGYSIKVITWLAIGSDELYSDLVAAAKIQWLRAHLPSVQFDDIIITEYGVPKSTLGNGILFDDNEEIRNEWKGKAYEPFEILKILRNLEEI